jgi:uncharacterized protein YdeI (YjbR/CyaY-like superfamily)
MKNPAIDAYIAKSAPFARPILKRLRALMHKADPRIVESLKWGVPHFEHNGIVAGMAAFKQHAAYGFWSKRLVQERLGKDAGKLYQKNAKLGMGGRRYHARAAARGAIILRAVKAAVALNEEGVRPTRLRKKPPVKAPPYLVAALKKNAKARATFERFTPAQQREYVEWLIEAKQEATRERRLATTIECSRSAASATGNTRTAEPMSHRIQESADAVVLAPAARRRRASSGCMASAPMATTSCRSCRS